MPESYRPPAVLGVFRNPHVLVEAVKALREQGFRGLDAYTPYPVHGLPEALGLKISWMPRVTKTMFFVGALLAFTFECWTQAWTWALNIAGKPFISVPAFMPVTFEGGILIAGGSTLTAVFIACRLWPKTDYKPIDERFTGDRFGLVVPVRPQESGSVATLLENLGAEEVKSLE